MQNTSNTVRCACGLRQAVGDCWHEALRGQRAWHSFRRASFADAVLRARSCDRKTAQEAPGEEAVASFTPGPVPAAGRLLVCARQAVALDDDGGGGGHEDARKRGHLQSALGATEARMVVRMRGSELRLMASLAALTQQLQRGDGGGHGAGGSAGGGDGVFATRCTETAPTAARHAEAEHQQETQRRQIENLTQAQQALYDEVTRLAAENAQLSAALAAAAAAGARAPAGHVPTPLATPDDTSAAQRPVAAAVASNSLCPVVNTQHGGLGVEIDFALPCAESQSTPPPASGGAPAAPAAAAEDGEAGRKLRKAAVLVQAHSRRLLARSPRFNRALAEEQGRTMARINECTRSNLGAMGVVRAMDERGSGALPPAQLVCALLTIGVAATEQELQLVVRSVHAAQPRELRRAPLCASKAHGASAVESTSTPVVQLDLFFDLVYSGSLDASRRRLDERNCAALFLMLDNAARDFSEQAFATLVCPLCEPAEPRMQPRAVLALRTRAPPSFSNKQTKAATTRRSSLLPPPCSLRNVLVWRLRWRRSTHLSLLGFCIHRCGRRGACRRRR